VRTWVSPGVWASALAGLGGLWMAGAPFWLGYQAPATAWSVATRSDVATGLAVFVVAAGGICAHLAYALRDASLDLGHGPLPPGED